MRNVSMIIWAMVLVLVAGGTSRADLTGYVVSYLQNDLVYFTNFDTGEQRLLGHTGFWEDVEVKALAFLPIDGRLFATISYASTTSDNLHTIDTTTGAASGIGRVGLKNIDNLAFAPDGTLYGITTRDDPHLITIDTATGVTTAIGSGLPYTNISAFAIDQTGKGIAWRWNNANTWESPLFEVDLTDGSTSLIGYLYGGFSAFDYGPDGILYGWQEGGMGAGYIDNFYRIDVENLQATRLQSFQNGWSQFAIIPEPATVLLLGLGALALLRRLRSE